MRLRPWPLTLLLAACVLRPPAAERTPTPQPDAEEMPSAECVRITRVEVRKSARTLVAFCARGSPISFRVALGRERGAKLRAGDFRTPEGSYRVSGLARVSRFHLFIPIDYPSVEDARRARDRGELAEHRYQEFVRSVETGSNPPQDSVLGGGLGLHGEGERWKGDSRYINWTNGCIALADAEIDFLAARLEIGTPVDVLP